MLTEINVKHVLERAQHLEEMQHKVLLDADIGESRVYLRVLHFSNIVCSFARYLATGHDSVMDHVGHMHAPHTRVGAPRD
jgi:hypothetical protein